jgi:hypothetical protein
MIDWLHLFVASTWSQSPVPDSRLEQRADRAVLVAHSLSRNVIAVRRPPGSRAASGDQVRRSKIASLFDHLVGATEK